MCTMYFFFGSSRFEYQHLLAVFHSAYMDASSGSGRGQPRLDFGGDASLYESMFDYISWAFEEEEDASEETLRSFWCTGNIGKISIQEVKNDAE